MMVLLKRVNPGGINKFLRFARRFYFKVFDFIGEIAFFILRLFRIVPHITGFTENYIKKILIIRLDRIGDVILSTPAIRAIRESSPNAVISILVREYTKDLVINNPNIDKLLIYEKDRIGNDYDLSISLHPGIMQNYITFTSGARYRIGYTGQGGGFFLTHRLIDDRETRIRHEVLSALEVAGAAGCKTEDKRLEISIIQEGERFAEDFFKKNNLSPNDLIVIIHPGARQEYIRWGKEGFAEVADMLIEENAKVILIGSREERGLVKSIISLMKEKPIPAVGLRLTELVSIIKRCNLFIGNSTGPMHIASALNVPVVAIFGNIHPLDSYKAWGPWGEGHMVVSRNLNCPGCHPGDCRDYRCMKLITPLEVLKAAREQLEHIAACGGTT